MGREGGVPGGLPSGVRDRGGDRGGGGEISQLPSLGRREHARTDGRGSAQGGGRRREGTGCEEWGEGTKRVDRAGDRARKNGGQRRGERAPDAWVPRQGRGGGSARAHRISISDVSHHSCCLLSHRRPKDREVVDPPSSGDSARRGVGPQTAVRFARTRITREGSSPRRLSPPRARRPSTAAMSAGLAWERGTLQRHLPSRGRRSPMRSCAARERPHLRQPRCRGRSARG